MAHKVEIENILNALQNARKDHNDDLSNWYFNLNNVLSEFNNFVNHTCENENITVKRQGFVDKLTEINNSIDNTVAALNEFKNSLPVLDDYWSADIADTDGLTDTTV